MASVSGNSISNGVVYWYLRVDYSGSSGTVYFVLKSTNGYPASAWVRISGSGSLSGKIYDTGEYNLGTVSLNTAGSNYIYLDCDGSDWGLNGRSSVTIGPQQGAFNLNILLPDGTEPYSTGAAGTVEFSSNGGTSYTRLYNEPASAYNLGTSFVCRNFIPGTGLHLNSVSGFTSSDLVGPWRATQAANTALEFKTAWNTYTIKYDVNGGIGTIPNQTKTYNTNLTLTSIEPTREYYTFTGWSLVNNAAAATYNPGQTLSEDLTTTHGDTITLYAVWIPNAPKNLSIKRTGGTPTTIDVEVSGYGLPMTYTVKYRRTGYGGFYSEEYLGSSTTGTLTNLDVDVDYDMYVNAGNIGGFGNSSNVTHSTLLVDPTISSLTVINLQPFSCTVNAAASISPSRTLSYAFTKDGGNSWTPYQSNGVYNWTDLEEETSYNMGVKVKATHRGVDAEDTYATLYSTVVTPADQAKIRIKTGGSWKQGKSFMKRDGKWKKIKKLYIKVNGRWIENDNV